jgi:hypothetical protein
MTTVFLLSPARCGGERAQMLARSRTAALGAQLRQRSGAPIGDVFAWLSALYFRGKLTYAKQFAPDGVYVMAPGLGLRPPEHAISARRLAAMGRIDIATDAFVRPLRRDAAALAAAHVDATVVLLGSIATDKYVDTLVGVFGKRLVFPSAFVGRGDMSRGGLLLRCVRAGEELTYVPVKGAVRHGPRPPKLAPIRGIMMAWKKR